MADHDCQSPFQRPRWWDAIPDASSTRIIGHMYIGGVYKPRSLSLWWPTRILELDLESGLRRTRIACQWGAPGDVPIGGMARTTGTFAGEFQPRDRVTVLRTTIVPVGCSSRASTYTGCGSALPSVYTNRQQPGRSPSVPDMTGDGLPEIWIVIRRFRNRSLP